MSRIRSLKPELLEDEKTATLPDREWRLFVSLILLCDDYGDFRATARLVEGQTLWGAGPGDETTDEALAGLENVGLISFYDVRGQRYGHVSNWNKHQKVDHPGKPLCPKPDDPEAWSRTDRVTYFVQQGESGPIKIGRAVDVQKRIARLQTSTPHKLVLLGTLKGAEREAELHKRFVKLRMTGEWFRPAPELVEFIRSETAAERIREMSRAAEASIIAPVSRDISRLTSDLDPDLDPDQEGPPREPTENLQEAGSRSSAAEPQNATPRSGAVVDPLTGWGLIVKIRAAVEKHHPELGLYNAGQWAPKAAAALLDGIPPEKRNDETRALILQRIDAFVRGPDRRGWTVESFCERFNELAETRAPPPKPRPLGPTYKPVPLLKFPNMKKPTPPTDNVPTPTAT